MKTVCLYDEIYVPILLTPSGNSKRITTLLQYPINNNQIICQLRFSYSYPIFILTGNFLSHNTKINNLVFANKSNGTSFVNIRTKFLRKPNWPYTRLKYIKNNKTMLSTPITDTYQFLFISRLHRKLLLNHFCSSYLCTTTLGYE